jgi:pimeloyl-ACP methyl ester carboxylesterase
LVHGCAAWSGVWEPVATELRQRGLKVVAVDLPPFGCSERPLLPAYGRADQAARIWAAVDALGGEEVVLVGHSFGAGPAMEAAMVRPEGTAGVVLLAGALSLGAEPGSLGPLGWRPLTEVATAATLTQPRAFPAGLRSMVHDDTVVTDAWVERYTRPLTVKGTTSAVADWLPELMAPAPGRSLEEASYRALDLPVLLVAGAEDRVTPPAQLEHVDGLLPRSTLVVLPDVGHLPPVEAPMEVVGQIEGFVRGL